MEMLFCHGRDYFEEIVPFGSEKNRCPFGMDIECRCCRFYRLARGV